MQYLVLIGFAAVMYGAFDYARDTLFGKTQPNRVTFAMWSLAPLIAAAAALVDGVTWAVVPVFAVGFFPFLVLLASFANKQAYWKLGPFDWACGLLSIIGLVLWQVTKNPNIAILFAILSDLSAALPTIMKSWKHPETETASFYTASIFSSATTFFALKDYSFAEVAFSIYIIFLCTLLSTLIYVGQYKLKRAAVRQ